MKRSNRYVIFYCDECDLLAGVTQLMIQMYPHVEIKMISNMSRLLDEVERKLPEYILVYLTIHNESYISVVKSIRESVNTVDTPVVIYQALPDETELRKLSVRMK